MSGYRGFSSQCWGDEEFCPLSRKPLKPILGIFYFILKVDIINKITSHFVAIATTINALNQLKGKIKTEVKSKSVCVQVNLLNSSCYAEWRMDVLVFSMLFFSFLSSLKKMF